jgi:hypothetical protein
MEVGKYWIYDVDSIVYNFIVPSTQQIDTFHYQLLESITDTFYDNQNRLNYRLELSTRIDTGNNTPWTFWKVWYCYKSARTFERQEDDLRFMKLVFPIQSDIAWNGNIFIPVNDTDAFCKWLLTDFRKNNATLMLAPASGFYTTPGLGKNEIRLAYVLNEQDINLAMDCLEDALKSYQLGH